MNNDQKTDHELMQAYLNADESAFAVIYNRHSGKIYAYLKKKLNNRQEADEVFQKVFLKFHQSRKNYQAEYPVLQWLYVIAQTTMIDHFRSQNRQLKIEDMPLSQNDAPEALNHERDVGLLDQLPNEQRQVLEMRIIDELSYEQIAASLNRTEVSIRQTVSRALKKLRSII